MIFLTSTATVVYKAACHNILCSKHFLGAIPYSIFVCYTSSDNIVLSHLYIQETLNPVGKLCKDILDMISKKPINLVEKLRCTNIEYILYCKSRYGDCLNLKYWCSSDLHLSILGFCYGLIVSSPKSVCLSPNPQYFRM